MTLYELTNEGLAALSQKPEPHELLNLDYFVNQRPASTLEDGVLTAHVFGPLLKSPTPLQKDLGATSYADLAEELSNPDVKAVLLVLNSPGGQVAGCAEVADLIANLPVPVVSFVDTLACSACYKLAVGSDWIVSSKTGTSGNIGTITVVTDQSELLKRVGVTVNAITNEGADLKATGHAPRLTEEQLAFLQDSINQAGAAFKNHVLANRPDIDPEVFRAGWFSGEKAAALGLIDEVGTIETAQERLREILSLTTSL